MRFSVEKLVSLIKNEFQTDLGKYNALSSVLLFAIFGGLHFVSSIMRFSVIFSSHKIAPGNIDKFLYFIGIYFLISLILLAFKK